MIELKTLIQSVVLVITVVVIAFAVVPAASVSAETGYCCRALDVCMVSWEEEEELWYFDEYTNCGFELE